MKRIKRIGGLLPCLLLLGACAPRVPPPAATVAAPHKQIISPPGATRIAPYSSAVRSGDVIFFAGVIGTLPGTARLIDGGIRAETRQTLENLRVIAAAAGLGFEDLVNCSVFLADIGEFAAMNEVYGEYFAVDPPARTTVGVAGLPLGARVEISCIGGVPAP